MPAPHPPRSRHARFHILSPPAIAACLALVTACASDPADSRQITVSKDSAGVQIMTSDPSLSDATCALGDSPTTEKAYGWLSSVTAPSMTLASHWPARPRPESRVMWRVIRLSDPSTPGEKTTS